MQIYQKPISSNRIAIYSRVNDFKLGEIDYSTQTFYSHKRSYKNVFRLFNGLGIAADLFQLDFKYIEIPFCGETLKCTKKRWLKLGILSPFHEGTDEQIILKIKDIRMDESEPKGNPQMNLFISIS